MPHIAPISRLGVSQDSGLQRTRVDTVSRVDTRIVAFEAGVRVRDCFSDLARSIRRSVESVAPNPAHDLRPALSDSSRDTAQVSSMLP